MAKVLITVNYRLLHNLKRPYKERRKRTKAFLFLLIKRYKIAELYAKTTIWLEFDKCMEDELV